MAFSDSNRVGVRYVAETAWSSTPAGPSMQEINLTSESLKSNINTVTSDTIRDDRNVSDITQVGGGAGGDIGLELRYGEYDDLIEACLQGSWATTVVSAGGNFNGATISGNGLQAVVSGNILRVTGATTGSNNGDYRVLAVTTTGASATISVAVASTGVAASFTSEVFGAGTRLQGKNLRNGVTSRSFTFEKEFADVSSFARYPGMRITAMTVNMEAQSILTGSFSMMGKTQSVASATLASTTVDPSTNPVMNASDNVSNIWEGAEAVSDICFSAISFTLNNNPREQQCVGQSSLSGIATGRAEVTGEFSAYFENNSVITKYTNGTKTNFRFQVDDSDGNSYVFDIPRVTLNDMTVAATGPNNDVLQEGTWGAAVNLSGTYAIQITALDA